MFEKKADIRGTINDLLAWRWCGRAFDPDRAMESFSIPERFEPMAMIAVGYQFPPEAIPADLVERERIPGQRNPLGDNFFSGSRRNPLT